MVSKKIKILEVRNIIYKKHFASDISIFKWEENIFVIADMADS